MKVLTRDQAESRKERAARFVENALGDPDWADEIRGEDLESWAERKHIELANPAAQKGRRTMAATTTKAELQQVIDDVREVLDNAYTPEASREDLAKAIGEALDIINPEDEEGDEDDDAEDDDTDDE